MTEINGCEYCGNQVVPMNQTYVDIKLTNYSWCEHCRERKEKSESHFFCSKKCFIDFMVENLDNPIEKSWVNDTDDIPKVLYVDDPNLDPDGKVAEKLKILEDYKEKTKDIKIGEYLTEKNV